MANIFIPETKPSHSRQSQYGKIIFPTAFKLCACKNPWILKYFFLSVRRKKRVHAKGRRHIFILFIKFIFLEL